MEKVGKTKYKWEVSNVYVLYKNVYAHMWESVCVFIGERDDGVYVFEGDAENLWCVCVSVCVCVDGAMAWCKYVCGIKAF